MKDKIDFSTYTFAKIAMLLILFTQSVTNCIEATGMMEWTLQQENLVRVPATSTMFSGLELTQMSHTAFQMYGVMTYTDLLSIQSMMRYTQHRFAQTYSTLAEAYAQEASKCTDGDEWVAVWTEMATFQRDMESMARGVLHDAEV